MRTETLTAAAYHIGRVKSQLASGAYPVEPSTCLCGNDAEATVIAERDRYGIPHRMVLCQHCGTIRADPRMTAEAYARFYQEEYRLIYDGWEFGPQVSDGKMFAVKGLQAEGFHEFLDFFDCHPRLVFDVGSGGGELVAHLKTAGIESIGFDGPDAIAQFEALGRLADVIVLQQVVEHLLDPLADLTRLRRLLAPEGLLFIGTPGLYVTRRELLFQNAHVWQFTTDTLISLMARAGFEEMYLDERIWSLWRAAEPRPVPPPVEEARLALQYLHTGARSLPLVKTINKFPLRERKENLKSALSRQLPDLSELVDREAGKRALIIGGGPSAEQFVSHIQRAQASGARVVTIERMNLWCVSHGIQPDYCVTLDASGDVVEAFKELAPSTVHLVAVQCPARVFDALAGQQVYLFNTPQRGIELGDFWYGSHYERVTMLNAGGSVTLGAMAAALCLGMRDLEVFGFDCHVGSGWYAPGIAGVGMPGPTVQVRVDDRLFTTTYSYLSFAQQFHLLRAIAQKEGRLDSIRLYGDSLAAAMSVEDIRGWAEVAH